MRIWIVFIFIFIFSSFFDHRIGVRARAGNYLLHPECVHKIFPDCGVPRKRRMLRVCAVVRLSHIYLYIHFTVYGVRNANFWSIHCDTLYANA